MSSHPEHFLPIPTFCLLLLSQLASHLKSLPHIPHAMSFFSNLLCGTLSNALAKSKHTTSSAFSLSTLVIHFLKELQQDSDVLCSRWSHADLCRLSYSSQKTLTCTPWSFFFHYFTHDRSWTHWSVVTRWVLHPFLNCYPAFIWC